MLDDILEYRETPEDDEFVRVVMKGVQRQRRQRRMILWGTGLIGAGFGVLGFSWLATPLTEAFETIGVMPLAGGIVLSAALIAWLLPDEAGMLG